MPFCLTTAATFIFTAIPACPQWQSPVAVIDLKPLGAASDLFANESEDKYQKRGLISVLWLGDDRIAAAFSTNPRFTNNDKPEPLHVRLVVFDLSGKQQNERDWSFGAEGPAADSNLDIEPGPDGSMLAVHGTNPMAGSAVPEGNNIQVLKPDASLQQNFYVPSTSTYVASWPSSAAIVVEQMFADNHLGFTWYRGQPLAPKAKLEMPRGETAGLIGPDVAAHSVCADERHCSSIRVYPSSGKEWVFQSPSTELSPIPRAFLSATALLLELRHNDKLEKLIVAHPDGTHTALPEIPGNQEILDVTGISEGGERFSLDTGRESKLCTGLGFRCGEKGQTVVIDVPARQVIFQEKLSSHGGTSALSPDGKHIAIFDKNKLTIYPLP